MKKRILLNIIMAVAGLTGLMDTVGCGRSSAVDGRLNHAEELMEERPDSALYILNGIDGSELRGSRIKARYALLKSMALDKNYIDTTNFDVLQPAIDYYLSHGTSDEKLRIYYYQGVIYKNAGNDDQAMESYMKAFDVDGSFSDSLILARMLVAQGSLYSKLYRIEDFVDNNLKAAEIYGKLGKPPLQLKSGLRALTGEIILSNRRRADSILIACKAIVRDAPSLKRETLLPFLKYAVNFGTEEEVRNMIEEVRKADMEDEMNMTLARAYSKIGDSEKGLQYLNEAKIAPDNILDSLTYWSVKTEISETLGEDKVALEAFKNYSSLLDGYHAQLFSNELLFAEKKHGMEIETKSRIQKRDRIIKWALAGVAVLLLIAVLTYHRYRLNKAGRLLAERNAEKLLLEGDKQRLLAEKLESEGRELRLKNEKLQLESEKQRLLAEKLASEGEGLRLKGEKLQQERDALESETEKLQEESEALREDSALIKEDRARLRLKAETLQRDSERLRKEMEQLELERDGYRRKSDDLKRESERLLEETEQLELDRDSYRRKSESLQSERDDLKGLLDRQEPLSEEARRIIRERMEMLNGLFAQAITNEEKYGKEFHKYVKAIRKDKKRFQESIGKVLEGTHPAFMACLREHGLTERETDYVCLYAIGLRGKEIGNYLDLARHYNISADIRRKLGLGANDENLGPFIRRMMETQ